MGAFRRYTGHWLLNNSLGGLRTYLHPHFQPQLARLGLLESSPAERRPDLLLTGNTFHDWDKLISVITANPSY